MEHKPHFEPEFSWEDIETDSRMVFRSLDEMSSFLDWRSGRLVEQLEAQREALRQIADGSWNFGNLRPGLTVMQYAREALNPASSRCKKSGHEMPEGVRCACDWPESSCAYDPATRSHPRVVLDFDKGTVIPGSEAPPYESEHVRASSSGTPNPAREPLDEMDPRIIGNQIPTKERP